MSGRNSILLYEAGYCWLSLRYFYKPDCQSQKANNAGRKPPVYIDEKIQHILASTIPLIIEFFYQNKKPIWKILITDKNINFKFIIKLLMSLDMSYIGYIGFLGIDLFKSVLMYSNGSICLIKLLFKMGLFTVNNILFLTFLGCFVHFFTINCFMLRVKVPCEKFWNTVCKEWLQKMENAFTKVFIISCWDHFYIYSNIPHR